MSDPSFCDPKEVVELLLNSESFESAKLDYVENHISDDEPVVAFDIDSYDLEDSEYKNLRMAIDKILALDTITTEYLKLHAENEKLKAENKKLKQFVLGVHNNIYGTKYDDEDIVDSMDLNSIMEECQ